VPLPSTSGVGSDRYRDDVFDMLMNSLFPKTPWGLFVFLVVVAAGFLVVAAVLQAQ
jgi:hypothetical protein